MTIRYDNAFTAGILASQFFNPPVTLGDFIFPSFDFPQGGNYTQANTVPWQMSFGRNVAFEPQGGAGGGYNGTNGKADPTDAFFNIGETGYASLSGAGAGQSTVGKGRNDGMFGIGGGKNIGQTSAGGGGGWFGGGSGYIKAGGGGGSGFVFTGDNQWLPYNYGVPSGFEGDIPPNVDEISGADLQYLLMELSQFIPILPPTLEQGVNQYNGKVEIYTPITPEPIKFEFTGKVQEYIIPETGIYRIDCFGAQGGGINGVTDPKYTGGLGGYASASYEFTEGTPLYIYVGESGRVQNMYNAWNGGGIGDGYMYGGGGATDVRFGRGAEAVDWKRTLNCRFIVAGGGGGNYGSNPGFSSDTSLEDIIRDDSIFTSDPPYPATPDGRPVQTDQEVEPKYYLLSNGSRVKVDMIYLAPETIPDGASLIAKLWRLNEEGVKELIGIQTKPLQPYTNTVTFDYFMNEVIPVEAGNIWDILQVTFEVVSNEVPEGQQDDSIILIVPPNGVTITVSTEIKEGESIAVRPIYPVKRHLIRKEVLKIVDSLKLSKEIPQHVDTDFDRLYDMLEIVGDEHHVYFRYATYDFGAEELILRDSIKFHKDIISKDTDFDSFVSNFILQDTLVFNRVNSIDISETETIYMQDTPYKQDKFHYKVVKKVSNIGVTDERKLTFLGREGGNPYEKEDKYTYTEDVKVYYYIKKQKNVYSEKLLEDLVSSVKYNYKHLNFQSKDNFLLSDILLFHRKQEG